MGADTATPQTPQPADTVLRAPTLADIDAAVACINRASRRLKGRDAIDAGALRGWWTQPPPFDLARDVVVAERVGEVVGYGDLGDQAKDGLVFWIDVRGEAATAILPELERRALERRVPDGVVRAYAAVEDETLAALLDSRGYTCIRASYRMLIELDGPRPVPSWPDRTSVRTAVVGADEPLLHRLNQETFADHWGFTPTPYGEWLHWLMEMGDADPSLWFVAEIAREPAGLCVCQPFEWGDPDCGWVSTLGVLPAFRGRGLGTALLEHALAAFQARGLGRAGLGVDAENTSGAVRLYERVGMRVAERQDLWELRT